MNRLMLITGGCRSGKSDFAQHTAETLPGKRGYMATCPVMEGDAEMDRRIEAHRAARAERQWDTLESPRDLAGAIGQAKNYDVLLVDCLTLWVNNLLFEAEQAGEDFQEADMARCVAHLLEAARTFEGTILFVTNEVGLGVVPENALARRYRDLVGRCNQIMASAAHEVTLVTCGLPQTLKKDPT
jgi:adenosylcobinamide kinase/adenosylcobinamide-phosphate guanylyltransferase